MTIDASVVMPDAGTAAPHVDASVDTAPPHDAALAVDSGVARSIIDPGTGPWKLVPRADVPEVCRLDPALLDAADKALQTYNPDGVRWAVVRYGRLCYASHADAPADEAFSTTKTLGALVLGTVAYQTRELSRNGRKTGPLSDEDRVDHWLDDIPYNKEAHIAHVLGMVAHNPDLALGKKTMTYDIVGATQINSLSTVMNAAIAQDAMRLGANLEEFTRRFVFGPLGMTSSAWSDGSPDKTLGFSWSTSALDMARIGLLMLHGGMWNGARILSEEYIYRMTHPSFEDANTGYGYLTWLNAASNFTFGDIPGAPEGKQQKPMNPGPCAPVSVFRQHPHGLSDSKDCNYASPDQCAQRFDVGVWAAVGMQGQVIFGHPGLDMVITVKNLTPLLAGGTTDYGFGPETPRIVWDALFPAIVSGDPMYHGNSDAFCAAYGSNSYAPDLDANETAP
ncbi:MAG: hypothetical protein RL385_245 [Pseudomonadota bacterium]